MNELLGRTAGSAAKALALGAFLLCGAARAQFLSEIAQPKRSGKRFAFYLGAVHVYDTNVYLDEDSVVADSVVRGLGSLSYESANSTHFLRVGYDFTYPCYLEESDLTEPEHKGLLTYDQSLGWGKLFLQNEFKRVSDPVNIEDPAVPFPKGKMTRMVNRLDPRVRFDLRAFELETGVVWQMSDYSPSELDYLDYQDLAFHGEAIVKAGSKGEFFTHFGLGDLEYVRGNGSGTGYAHTRLYGGYRGESSPKFAYEAAGGLLALDPAEGDYATDLYLTARATWEPAPGINRLMVNFRRDVRPSGIAAYAVADRAELSYAHWLKTRSHVETGASFESGRTPGGAGDWRTVGGFGGLRYEMGISRYFFVRYEHRARDSGVAGADFAADRVSSGLVYRF